MVAAALDLIDDEGLAALSMRTLAARLGVSAMTPYGYFASKAELIEAMAQQALAALVREPGADATWQAQLRAEMGALHAALAEHPGVVELLVGADEPRRLAEIRRDNIALLQETGMTQRDAIDVLRTLISFVVGHTVMARRRPDRDESFERGLELMLGAL